MQWKEFKKAVEDQGVTDETEIEWVDVGSPTSYPEVQITKDDTVTIIG